MSNYVDKPKLLAELIAFKALREKHESEGLPAPQIPNSIAHDIMTICKGLGSRYNFRGYSFKDDMVSAAIMQCISKVNNFDPAKSDNPFGYFTFVAWRAMGAVIIEERGESYLKAKMSVEPEFGDFDLQDSDSDKEGSVQSEYTSYFDWKSFEDKYVNRPKKKKCDEDEELSLLEALTPENLRMDIELV